jgi:hypothetical protein
MSAAGAFGEDIACARKARRDSECGDDVKGFHRDTCSLLYS